MKVVVKTYYYLEKYEQNSIRQFMKDNDLSYRKMGKELGCSGSYLHDMIHNRRAISLKLINYFKEKGLTLNYESK